jgi:DNA helicase II / ATP-dependent DNA helicase PcrA
VQAIAPSTLVPGRRLDPARLDPEAAMVGVYPAASVADEADFVVRTVDELVGGLSHRSHDSRVDARTALTGAVSFSDIAVLYRADAQAAPIVDALSRAGVPVQKRSHDRLLDRPGVAAIARELRFASGLLPSAPLPRPLLPLLPPAPLPRPLGGSLAARVRLAGQIIAERCNQLDTDLLASGLTPADVWSAVELLTPLAQRFGDDLGGFLGELSTGAEVDAWDPRADRVTLLTLHASKGLEFPVVFLVGCEDGLLPLRMPGSPHSGRGSGAGGNSGRGSGAGGNSGRGSGAGGNPEAVAEERRLFFVGITRAQDRLFISHARKRFRHGAEREMSPTPFLSSIDPGLLERRGEGGARKPKDRQLRLI